MGIKTLTMVIRENKGPYELNEALRHIAINEIFNPSKGYLAFNLDIHAIRMFFAPRMGLEEEVKDLKSYINIKYLVH